MRFSLQEITDMVEEATRPRKRCPGTKDACSCNDRAKAKHKLYENAPAIIKQLLADSDDTEKKLLEAADRAQHWFGLMEESEQKHAKLRGKLEAALEVRRCSDHGCTYGHSGGMGTNGGCSMGKMSHPELRVEHRKFVKEVREALEADNDDEGSSCSLSPKGLDNHGELEIEVEINNVRGSCYLSKEMWQSIGGLWSDVKERS